LGLLRRRAPSRPFVVPSDAAGSPRRTPIGKEERERLLLEELRKSGCAFPEGLVRRGEDREGRGPDFLVEDPPGRTVAIEVTELYREDERAARKGSSLREQEGLRRKFTKTAEDGFYSSVPPGQAANISFHWLPGGLGAKELSPRLVREAAPRAASLVLQRLAGSGGSLVHIGEDELRAAGLGDILTSIQARKTRPFPDGRASPWCSSGPSFSLVTLGIAPLESAIAAKEAKLVAYRGWCDEAWLLLAATGGPSSYDDVALPHSRCSTDG
jgi:hypothetical protein